METTFDMMTLHYMVKLLKASYSDVLGAIKALGLRGRQADRYSDRVWTRAEYQQIRAHLGR